MEDKLINTYMNMLANKVNELNLENILLKSKLTIANEQVKELQAAQSKIDGDSNKTKTK